jgi:alpha-mannosidase
LPDGLPCGDLLQAFVDTPKRWDAWNIDADFVKHHTDLLQADEVKLIENTPLRAVIRVRHHFQNSMFVQDITMVPGVARVDVHMQADWHERHILLKVAFSLSARNDQATFEISYGSVERPTTRNTPAEQAQFEVPALRWADISDGTHGFSLLNDSKYGYDAKDNILRLSLLRAPHLARSGDGSRATRIHVLALSSRRHVAPGHDRATRLRVKLSAFRGFYDATRRVASGERVILQYR